MPAPHQPLVDGLRRLRASWPSRGWSFDNRFECVASSFDADAAPQARTILSPLFPQAYSAATLASAGPTLTEIATRTGGVRAGQMIFGAPPLGHLTPYALWWPWEEGRVVSLRVGLEGARYDELVELCAAFGVEL